MPISVTYGYLADAQAESGDLAGALESHRRSRALRRQLSAEFPENATYAEAAQSARYYEATMLGRMGRWEEALVLHREGLADNPTGSFDLCRVGEALAALGRHEEALGYLTHGASAASAGAAGRYGEPVQSPRGCGGPGTRL